MMNHKGAKGIVRLLMGRRPTVDDTSPSTGDAGLSLMHLRKLFMEFIHSSVPLTLKEQEKKLYVMLPVFNNVFSNAEGTEMTERFGDVLQFAAHSSRLMVNEIRRRALNKSNADDTRLASTAVMDFLIEKPDNYTQSGWNLLRSLSILAKGECAIVSDMIAAQLPSTLVRCLYLFLKLPKPSASSSDETIALEESYLTVQKLFIQLFVSLCNQSITAQELVRTDDLFILFTAMTHQCEPHNVGWRTGICEVLTSITRHGLRSDVCNYIHAKTCVSQCISSMHQIHAESPLELVEIFITLFSIFKDSTAISSVLMDDFRSCHGYLFLQDYLLQLGEIGDNSAAEACRNMIICVSNFTMVGFTPLRPSRSIGAPFQDSGFQIPEATENGNTVRNIEAFNVLQTVFIKSQDSLLCQHILDSILRIYTSDHVNYFILEPQRTISTFIEKLHDKEALIQEKVFKLLEFVACNLNWTPSPELISLSILFKNTKVNSSWIFGLECLIQLVSYKDQYKNVFRDVGLLEVLTNCLVYYSKALKNITRNEVSEDEDQSTRKRAKGLIVDPQLVPNGETLAKFADYPMLLMECVRIMLEKCPENAVMFRKCGGAHCVHSLIRYDTSRGEALKIIQELILNDGKDDLGALLGSMHSCTGSVVPMKIDLLRTVIQVFVLEPASRAMFRNVGGFVYVMSVLMSMEGAMRNEPSPNWKDVERSDVLELFRVVFYVLTSAMQDEPANKTFFMDEVRYKGLADSLRLLGCFDAISTTLSTGRSISPTGMKTRLNRTRSTRSSIYVDPKVPKFHPKSSLFAALHILHCLLDMAMDSFTLKTNSSVNDETDTGRVYPLDVSCICHPGAITVLVELLPSIVESEQDLILHEDGNYQDALDLQLYVANKVQSCLRSERNQQVMCQAGLPQQILLHCQTALELEEHPLHLPLQRIFERLATQALTPVVLRDFMRLAHPLRCAEVEIHEVTKREDRPRADTADGLANQDTADNVSKASSDATSDVHKQSLLKDFNETLFSPGDCFPDNRSRASSTSSISGGEEGHEGTSDDNIDGPTKSRFIHKSKTKRMKPRSKSKSKFYTPSPTSSMDGIDVSDIGSPQGSMGPVGSPDGNVVGLLGSPESGVVYSVNSRGTSLSGNMIHLGSLQGNVVNHVGSPDSGMGSATVRDNRVPLGSPGVVPVQSKDDRHVTDRMNKDEEETKNEINGDNHEDLQFNDIGQDNGNTEETRSYQNEASGLKIQLPSVINQQPTRDGFINAHPSREADNNPFMNNQLPALKLPGDQLSGDQLSGDQLSGDQLSGDQLSGDQLSGNQLSGEKLSGDQLTGEKLSGDQLTGEKLSGDQLSGDQLSGDQLSGEATSGKNGLTRSPRTPSTDRFSDLISGTHGAIGSPSDDGQITPSNQFGFGSDMDLLSPNNSVTEIATRQGGGPVALSRIKCLVSMTTPRDMHLCGTTSLPGFVEFNMSLDGFGCLFLPSIAPHVPTDTAIVGSMAGVSSAMIGAVQGIGASDRTFPPQAGVTYIAWFCVERFSTPFKDPHPIRLLTVCCRTKQIDGTYREDTCLNIRISGNDLDRSLVVTTEEELTVHTPPTKKSKSKSRNEARFPLRDRVQEGYWHHIVVTLNRALISKHSTATAYLDGCLVGTEKLRYIQNTSPGNASFTVSTIDVYIGTRRSLRRCSKLMWQLGPCHFLEEPIQAPEAALMYQLGPSYLGSFQAPFINKNNHSGERDIREPLVAEANIVFGLHAHATSLITIAKLRKHFSKPESRAVAQKLGLSKKDNSTPVRLVHNTASHLQGPSRCLGGIIIGISGVRTFVPRPVAELVSCVGGTTTLLGLVAMANDVEMLYAGVKALSCVLKHSFSARQDMERIKGYQILALLFKRKTHLLNTHILHLTFALVGTVDSEREMSTIPNEIAFKDLLCDFQVWSRAPENLQKSLLVHFLELLSQPSQLSTNVALMQDLGVVAKLLFVLKDETTPISTIKVTCEVLTILLNHVSDKRNAQNILRFGQFLTWTMSSAERSETQLDMSAIENTLISTDGRLESPEERLGKKIVLRNFLLEIFLTLVSLGKKGGVNERFSMLIQDVLGFDWIMLFMKENIHSTTVVRALRLLVIVLSESNALERFREGSHNGGWLKGTEALASKSVHVVGGFNVKASTSQDGYCEVNRNAVNVPGFVSLNRLLSKHVEVPEIYHLVISLLLKHPVADVDAGKQFDWDSLYHVFWVSCPSISNTGPPPSPLGPEKHSIYCAEAASVLLSMARMVCGKEWQGSPQGSWLVEYPVTVVQFLTFLYHNVEQFSVISSSQDFIEHLVAVAFPEVKQVRIVSTDDSSLKILDYARGTIVMCHDDKETLIRHPAKRLIMGFIRVLITDALTTPPFLKAASLVDTILESFPSSSKLHQIQEFQTEVLHSQMEYLLAGNLLTNPGKVLACICSFTSKIVDKLWQDYFNLGYKPIFNFIISIINSSKGHSTAKDGAFHSLNRVILYQLSRELKELTDFTEMLEFLHLLTANDRIVFSAVNNNGDFIASLCYHLLIMTGATLPEYSNHEDEKFEFVAGPQDFSHSSVLLTAAAVRVWEKFILLKKDVIENVFKIEFPKATFTKYPYGSDGLGDIPIAKSFKTMNLDPKSLGPVLLEPAKKIWDSFNVSQLKPKVESPKIQKSVRNPLGRRTVNKKEKIVDLPQTADTDVWTNLHIDLAKKLFLHQHRNYLQNYKLIERSIAQDWSSRRDDLTRVRGLWGPPSDSRLDKWMLDMVEGPCRMRKKMCQNDSFYDHYSYKTDVKQSGKPCKFKIPMSFDSRLYAMLSNQKVSALEMKMENKFERSISDIQTVSTEFKEVEVNENNDMEDQTILKLLEAGERIRSMFRCARVEGLDHAEGLFLFGQSHFYVVNGVTLLSTKEIKDIDSLPVGAHEPIIPRSSHDSGQSTFKKISSTWAYEAVREVQKRRYLLQDTALEVFSSDGRNHLLVFPKSVRDKVYNKMLDLIPDTSHYVSGQKPDTEVEASLNIITSIIGERSVTQRWERGDISNFQYLMYLNTLSGRSYNDLMQYPVFPWIIADYESEELDLNNPDTFRDLSKPMGAQTEGRLKDFKKRYREWDDPTGETPAYHYATHYSSAMVVASYLVRMEPFAQHFLRLQDGHFDLPDRMFHGVKDAWLSASETNMADVKELIPEFFYLPEFLLNENRFDLGQKQSGVVLGDVILPRWAKGDVREFIRLHRKALECDFVSSKLHLWIDLIFGCKQRGEAAKEAINVFHHWFYSDSADIMNIEDPVKRNAKIGFINNFGQTPRQLFKKPHVSKKAFLIQDQEQSGASVVLNTDKFFSNFTKMMPSTQPVKEIKGPVGDIVQSDKGILAVKKNHAIFPPPCNQYVSWGYGDLSLRIGQLDGDKIIAVMEDFQVGQILCAACPDARTLITGGKNTLVYVWMVDRENKDKRPQLSIHEILYGHLQPVTCLAVSSSYNLIVSGSEDMTCIIWDLNKLTYVRQLRGHVSAISTISINNLTGDIITCAGTHLYLWSVNGQLIVEENTSLRPSNPIHCCLMSELSEWDEDVILTGDQDGIVKMWSVEFFDESLQNAKPCKRSDQEDIDEVLDDKNISSEDAEATSTSGLPQESESPENELTVPNAAFRSSSLSPSEEYVIIDESEQEKPVEKPVEPAMWKRRLVMRSQLTMHTAFSREDNHSPAAVTAMLLSKDHKKLYVGDARGRVYSWSVSDTAGRIADHWVKDESSYNCTACHVKFSAVRERRHHCRDCGRLFCSKCSDFQSRILRLNIRTPVRVCFSCYTKLNDSSKSIKR